MSYKRILLVEDEFLVGLNIQSTLTNAGFEVFGPALNAQAALKLIAENDFDAAVLDVNLGGQSSDGIASKLAALDIPFLLLTGYDRENLPTELANAPLMEKPFDENELVEMIIRLSTQNDKRSGN
ncbi:MAG: response regulator [Balneolales bacterium]